MATLAATVTGNLNTTSWVSGDTGTNAVLLSTSASTTALTTGNLDSATFTLSANAMQYILLRLGSRGAGSPSNTMTITLVNSTSAGNRVPSAWVINVSDLPVCTTAADDGGYILLKANATWTPNGTDVYLVRVTLSATTTPVSLCTNGTANNWQRAVFRAATATPAATDDMHVAAQFSNSTNPATRSTFTITQDLTAATDFGSANTSYRIPALAISAGSVTSGITASTAYILQLSGWAAVFLQGTLNLGTVANPVPRGTGSSTLQFDCVADNDFGLTVRNGTVVGQGLSRTSAKNVTWTLLTADIAAAGTAMTVADDTGWLSGDTVAIASTSRTGTEAESFTLNGNAGASSVTANAGLGAAHKGSTAEKMQAELVLLTRSVVIKSVNSSAMSSVVISSAAQCDFDWVLFQNMGGSTAGNIAIDINTTTGSATFDYCALVTVEQTGFKLTGAVNGGTVAIRHTVGYSLATISTSGVGFIHLPTSPTTTGIIIDDVVGIGDNNVNCFALIRVQCNLTNITLTNVRLSCSGGTAGSLVEFIPGAGVNHGNVTVGPFYLHSAAGNTGLMLFNAVQQRLKLDTTYIWHGTGYGLYFNAACVSLSFTGTTVSYGHTTAGVELNARVNALTFADLRAYGSTSFSQPAGIAFDVMPGSDMTIVSGDFGTAAGLFVTHSTADLDFNGTTGSAVFDIIAANTNLASSTPVRTLAAPATIYMPSSLRLPHYNKSATSHKVMTPVGDVAYDTGTVDVTPSIKMTPSSASIKLDTAACIPGNGFYVPCDSGNAVTPSIKVQIDGSYNGAAPRLILKANAGIGITADTVIATHPGGTGSFSTLTAATAAPTAKGVMEFVVDCDGTAGNVFVDTFVVTGSGTSTLSGLSYWYNGSAC